MLNISPALTGTTGGNSPQLKMSPLVVPSGDPSTWTQAQIQAMTQSDIQSLTQAQIGELSPTQMGYFTTTQIPYFTATQITYFSQAQIAGFTTAQFAAFTASQLGAFTTAQVPAFSAAQIGALSQTQVAGLASAQINAFTASQFNSLKTSPTYAIRGITVSTLDQVTTATDLDSLDDRGCQPLFDAGRRFDLCAVRVALGNANRGAARELHHRRRTRRTFHSQAAGSPPRRSRLHLGADRRDLEGWLASLSNTQIGALTATNIVGLTARKWACSAARSRRLHSRRSPALTASQWSDFHPRRSRANATQLGAVTTFRALQRCRSLSNAQLQSLR